MPGRGAVEDEGRGPCFSKEQNRGRGCLQSPPAASPGAGQKGGDALAWFCKPCAQQRRKTR